MNLIHKWRDYCTSVVINPVPVGKVYGYMNYPASWLRSQEAGLSGLLGWLPLCIGHELTERHETEVTSLETLDDAR